MRLKLISLISAFQLNAVSPPPWNALPTTSSGKHFRGNWARNCARSVAEREKLPERIISPDKNDGDIVKQQVIFLFYLLRREFSKAHSNGEDKVSSTINRIFEFKALRMETQETQQSNKQSFNEFEVVGWQNVTNKLLQTNIFIIKFTLRVGFFFVNVSCTFFGRFRVEPFFAFKNVFIKR